MSKSKETNDFFCWLIGFTEGDGSFVVNKRGFYYYSIYYGRADTLLYSKYFKYG